MRRRRLLFRGGMAVLLMAALLTTAQSSRADDEPEWYPGLPDATFGSWANTSQGSMSYARRAKQWFISPTGMTVAEFAIDDLPQVGDAQGQRIPAEGYFVSPKGAPGNYGYLEPMTVRSVGFGMIPVEATVQVSQRREDGFPVPVRAELVATSRFYSIAGRRTSDYTVADTKVSDSFNVKIVAVKVDGVDLGLNGDCRTVEPAPVAMTGPGFTIIDTTQPYKGRPAHDTYYAETGWYLDHDVSTYFHPTKGGELTGTMTIPAFTGCTTAAGDDLSRLLTLSVSGADNPVKARVGFQCPYNVDNANAPAPPGASNPRLATGHAGTPPLWHPGYCPGIKPFEYPTPANE
jgi:hypothetical protein